MEFNPELTEAELVELERRIGIKDLTSTAAARIIGITQPVMSRWVRGDKSLWERYSGLRKKKATPPLAEWTITDPEGVTRTYGECAKMLRIGVQSFARRVRQHGADSPRTWTIGRNADINPETPVSGAPSWGGLTNKSRDHVLSRIPEPTEYERRLYEL